MPKTITVTELRKNFKQIFDYVDEYGEVLIRHRNGKLYSLRLVALNSSPFDVSGLDTGITRQEVLDSIRESRERDPNNRHEDN